MRTQSSNAFLLSLLLHGSAVVAIFLLAYVVHRNTPPPLHVFDLVAGPPTDPTATAAPALGSPEDTVKVSIPKMPAMPEPVAPPPPPTPAAEPEPVAPRAVAEPVAPPKPHAVKPARHPEPKHESKSRAPSPSESKMSYEQYVKKYGQPKTSTAPRRAPARHVPRIDVHGIAEGVLGGSTTSRGGGGGNAMTAAEHSALDAYISRLVTALRQNHEKPPGLSDLLSADVEFFIAADGSISRVRIVRSSGNAAFDASCIEAFRRVGSVGPKPDGRSETWVLTFKMKDE